MYEGGIFFIKRQASSGDIHKTIGDASEITNCGLWNVTFWRNVLFSSSSTVKM
jgi:hypothetical protein